MQPLAFIPSPSQGVWHLGPVPLRAYAIMIIIGIVVAVWLGERRWAAKGGAPGVIIDVAVWAVPFGLVGGRVYHVVTDYQHYFGEGEDPINALKIWEGGLGIWGAVVFGALGALIGCRRRGISVLALGDAVAPGIALAQGIGRWGNYWNQELYGRPLDTFWGLEIDRTHRPRLSDGGLDPKYADVATFHPTFLYESLWCVGVAILVIWAGRRYSLTHGRAFALYVAAYTVGRFWIEWLRIDDAHHILGMRLNDWTSLIVFLGAVGYLYWARGRTGPENVGHVPDADSPVDAKAEPASEPETEADETPVTEAETKVDVETKVDEKPAVKAEAEAEAEPEPEDVPAPGEKDEPEAGADDAPEPKAEPESKPEGDPEDGPEPEVKDEPEAKDEPEPDPEPEEKSGPGGDDPAAAGKNEGEDAGGERAGKEEPVKDSK